MPKGSRWQGFLQFLGLRPKPVLPKPVVPNYKYNPKLIPPAAPAPRGEPEQPAEQQEQPPALQPPRGGPTSLSHFHYLKGPEYPVSSWVVSYALAEHRDSGEIGMIIGLLSGQAKAFPGHTGGVGLGRGKRLGGYKPIKGNTINDFWYPGLGEDEYESMNAAGSKGEWMDRHIVKQKKTYQNLGTGSWGPKGG
jgi:hypothetical protein